MSDNLLNNPSHEHCSCGGCSTLAAAKTTSMFRLEGLDCPDCAAKLEKKLAQLPGVESVKINFSTSKMTLEHSVPTEMIIKAVSEAGYKAILREGQGQRETQFRIGGLDCADCAAKLEKRISGIPGVEKAMVNFGSSKMTVHHSNMVDSGFLIKVVKDAGYSAEVDKGTQENTKTTIFKNKKVILTGVSGILLAIGLILSYLKISNSIVIPFYIASILIGGFYTGRSALYSLKSLSMDMNFLMTVAVLGAAAIGEWAEGATVVFLFSLGNTLQAYTMEKTRNSIRALMDLSPREALVRRNNEEVWLPVEEIVIGDVIIVKPGERFAMDGEVIQGRTDVNQASITGESMPVEKKSSDEVYAGTINGQGSVEVKVTKLVEDTTLSKIINLVEEAQAQKAPSQQFVDVFAKYYTPSVIVGALLVATVPWLAFGQPFQLWFERALILLVISCPCALVISTPVSIVSAIGSAAKKGVLIKGGAYLEEAGALKVIAFDKTGTLTAGKPQVTDVIPLSVNKERVLQIAAAIERLSQHPLADAILKHAREKSVIIPDAEDFQSFTGKGAGVKINGQSYYIGNPRLFEDMNNPLTFISNQLSELQNQGKTAMIVGTDKEILGIIAVADSIRDTSIASIKGLRQAGIAKLVMLTGDNHGTAKVVAGKLGIDEYRANLLPENKLEDIRSLQEKYGRVAMVGDGVNDAPALAAATVGIAMGGAGTDTSLETADIVLMADDLTKLPYAIHLSRSALKIIKQNITFSLLVKVVFIAATFAGFANLWLAVFADTGAALLVIANGMRLMRVVDPYRQLKQNPTPNFTDVYAKAS